MSKVLKLLNRNLVINEPLNQLVLESGKILIPIKRNSFGVFVEHTKQNETLLYEQKQGYIAGTLGNVNGYTIFNKIDPHNASQVIVDCDQDLGISLPFISDDIKIVDQADTIAALIDMKFNYIRPKVVAVPIYSQNNNIFTFELFRYKAGFAQKVYLIHNKLGLVKIVLRPDFKQKIHNVKLEQKYFTINAISESNNLNVEGE